MFDIVVASTPPNVVARIVVIAVVILDAKGGATDAAWAFRKKTSALERPRQRTTTLATLLFWSQFRKGLPVLAIVGATAGKAKGFMF